MNFAEAKMKKSGLILFKFSNNEIWAEDYKTAVWLNDMCNRGEIIPCTAEESLDRQLHTEKYEIPGTGKNYIFNDKGELVEI